MRVKKFSDIQEVAIASTGETLSLTAEQIQISNGQAYLWSKPDSELIETLADTNDASIQYACIDILKYRRTHGTRTDLEKALNSVSIGLAPARNALDSAISSLGQSICMVLVLQNEERKAKGLEAKDSLSLGLLNNRVFTVKRTGYPETHLTVSGDLNVNSRVAKKALKAISKDAAWRLNLSKQALKNQEAIKRAWNESLEAKAEDYVRPGDDYMKTFTMTAGDKISSAKTSHSK